MDRVVVYDGLHSLLRRQEEAPYHPSDGLGASSDAGAVGASPQEACQIHGGCGDVRRSPGVSLHPDSRQAEPWQR